jgi:hypothetical protein
MPLVLKKALTPLPLLAIQPVSSSPVGLSF